MQSVKVSPIVYWNAAKVACRANVETIKSIFPQIDKRDVPFLCMDLGYEYTLLVHGFGKQDIWHLCTSIIHPQNGGLRLFFNLT